MGCASLPRVRGGLRAAGAWACVVLAAAAIAGSAPVSAADASAPASEPETLVWDPWETMNRGIFAFNMELDEYLLEPVGRGWNFLVPEPGQKCVSHVFENLTMPVRIGNDILQLKPIQAIQDFFRLFANSVLGLGGCFDVATWRGMPNYDEDFGLTLGYWGVPSGPYLVLPFFGPSSPRDGVGLLADSFMAVHTFFLSFPILAGAFVVDTVNARALTLEEVAAERASALDFYSAVRGAYVQFRRGKLEGSGERGAEDAALEDDLYYFDEEEEVRDE